MQENSHENECQCDYCKYGHGYIKQKQENAFKKYGWCAHFVTDYFHENQVNYHTHGLPENFNHLDLQLVLPIDFSILHSLAVNLVNRIKSGESFRPNMRISDIVKSFNVTFIEAKENERTVLRVILPDKHGNLDRKTIQDGIFKDQFIITE
ncbi:MAG: DUF4262 domain-containing protein [bacterium]|nr:DUF4262 domain-containing protein [bacterium]